MGTLATVLNLTSVVIAALIILTSIRRGGMSSVAYMLSIATGLIAIPLLWTVVRMPFKMFWDGKIYNALMKVDGNATVLMIKFLTFAIIVGISRHFWKRLEPGQDAGMLETGLDKGLGAVFGILKVAIVCWLINLLLITPQLSRFTALKQLFDSCIIYRAFSGVNLLRLFW